MQTRVDLLARLASALLVILAAAGPTRAQYLPSASPLGFTPSARADHLQAEARALAVPTPEHARSWLRTLTAEPHVAGTPADYQTAVFVRDQLRAWGWHADLAEYEVLLNYPTGQPTLEITRPTPQTLKVIEDPHPADKDSANPSAFPAFHGYGVSGEVIGPVVYANYARPEDFETLETLGVDVKDKVVLARYGMLFRGLKVREAQKRGARGLLIYSDPADDGYARGDIYPHGPFRPPSAIQRGSVQFLSLQPGDPTTPGWPSLPGAERLPIDRLNGFPVEGGPTIDPVQGTLTPTGRDEVEAWEAETGLTRADYFAAIPSLPISYEAAEPILRDLGGANVPGGWQGGLPFAYHVGPGPVEVRFAILMDYQIRPVWNVIAKIEGHAEPDRWVMVGNHRDAWTYGAVDPGSGTAATLEMCRAIGEAVQQGWSPRRTIVYASWDAEEYGLVGSTEWAEHHAEALTSQALLMLNVDSAVAGTSLDLDGIPSLRDLVLDAAGAVTDVRSGKPLDQVWLDARRSAWANTAPVDLDPTIWDSETDTPEPSRADRPFVPQMDYLGSGSDYTVFVDHLGIPAIDVNFTGRYGVYHSVYDNFYWMEKFGDPEFVTHAMAAKLYTAMVMRAAGAEVAPLRFGPYGDALRDHVDDLRRLVIRKARAAGPDPEKPPLTFEDLPTLIRAVRAFQEHAEALDQATAALAQRDDLDPEHLARVNDALMHVERAFLHPDGLPGRPWFKHLIYAPGLTTGYASWPLPGVRQAILEDDPELLATELPKLVDRIDAATEALRTATEATQD